MKKLSRRKVLKDLCIGSAGLLLAPSCLAENQTETKNKVPIQVGNESKKADFKIVIKNGKAYINQKLQEGYFIGIDYNGKLKISPTPLQAEQEIDATGKVVSPGFIDILADNANNPEQTYTIFEKYKVTDGLTTVFQMHGGAEFPKKFHDYFDKLPHRVNYGVSVFVMRLRLKYASLAQRYQMAEKGLQEGALAMAHSPEYQPDTSYEELKKYGEIAKKYERPYFLHLRYSSQEKELEGVKEAIR
ncbi:MAG: nitrate reductase, partial [Raineya sp.]|nr:nitrate reductase [Raineya sp.]